MPDQPSKFMPALYGGIIMGVISGVPGLSLVNCLCCAGILFGGFMSVFFYKKDLQEGMPLLTSGDAVQLGALAGVFGAIVGTAISAVIMQLAGNVGAEMLMKFMESYRDRLPPGALDQMSSKMLEGGISAVTLIISLIIDTIFGLLGGLIGFAVFKPKPAMRNMQPPTPPVAQP